MIGTRHLTDFLKYMNEEVGGTGPLPDLTHGSYGNEMGDSLGRHFAEDRQRGGLRMSNLGKPSAVLALAKLGYIEPEPKGKSRLIFHMGDMFENFLEVMMLNYGIEVLESQTELKWGGITGHLDFVIKSPVTGEPVIVEAKTMSDNYARMFTRELNDHRGYISQLAMYRAAKGDIDATWCCLNKGNAEMFEIVPEYPMFDYALNRATKVIAGVNNVKSLEDVLDMFQLPPGRPERYKNKETGRMLLNPAISFSPFATALYKITEDTNGYGKTTKYVDGPADIEHLREELAFLVDIGKVIYEPAG